MKSLSLKTLSELTKKKETYRLCPEAELFIPHFIPHFIPYLFPALTCITELATI